MFDDLIVELDPPPNRCGKCTGSQERHLTEAAVMLAYAMHLLRTVPHLTAVELHPDGEHGKRLDIVRWLSTRGFMLKQAQGTTSYCGTYVHDQQVIKVTSIPGKGDVVAMTTAGAIIAECKVRNREHKTCGADIAFAQGTLRSCGPVDDKAERRAAGRRSGAHRNYASAGTKTRTPCDGCWNTDCPGR
jgi:hypothetical protein